MINVRQTINYGDGSRMMTPWSVLSVASMYSNPPFLQSACIRKNILETPNNFTICAFGRWFLLPQGNDAETLEPICLSRKEDEPCTIGYSLILF